MFALSRALFTLLIAIVVPPIAALAWAEPATDRPFFREMGRYRKQQS
jgi:hypothetical protein